MQVAQRLWPWGQAMSWCDFCSLQTQQATSSPLASWSTDLTSESHVMEETDDICAETGLDLSGI